MSTLAAAVASTTRDEYRLTRSLNNEWRLLCTSSAALRELADWRLAESALFSVEAFEDLPSLVANCPNRVHEALIRLAQNGSTLAGRSVIQLMLPKIALIARSQVRATLSFEEAASAVLAAMWAQIMRFRLDDNPPSIAAYLALNSLKEVSRAAERDRVEVRRLDKSLELDVLKNHHVNAPERNAGVEVIQVLARATARKVITTDEAQLLADVYIRSDNRAGEAVARELNISHASLRQRCSRLTRKLRDNADLLAA